MDYNGAVPFNVSLNKRMQQRVTHDACAEHSPLSA